MLLAISKNGSTPIAQSHPAFAAWVSRFRLPLEVGVYARGVNEFVITELIDQSAEILALKQFLKSQVESKFERDVAEKYTLVEISVITALQVEIPVRFSAMKTYILPLFNAMVSKKQEISACTTYEQLMGIQI